MMPPVVKEQAPIPPPSSQRAQARLRHALHLDALPLVTTLHWLALCRLAVRLAHRRCPPPLPPGPGGAPRTSREENLLLISLLRPLWRLSSQDMHDWLLSWPALALACGLPRDKQGQLRIPRPSQQCKRRHAAGAPLHESLFVLVVLQALRGRLIGARDLLIESAPILACRRHDPDAADRGMLPLTILVHTSRGFRVHTLICRGSGLPLFFLLSPAHAHDAPFAKILLAGAVHFSRIRPRIVRFDAASWGVASHCLDSWRAWCCRCHPLESPKPEEPFLLATNLDHGRTGQTQQLPLASREPGGEDFPVHDAALDAFMTPSLYAHTRAVRRAHVFHRVVL